MTQIYDNYEDALARVESLKKDRGMWPGIVDLGQRWRLTYDPGDRLHG